MLNSPHSVVDKYQILELVGEGAMGSVYRARDPVLNRVVAVKVMSDAIARDDSLRDRFMREAQAAGSLQHPNVVTVFDFGDFDGHLFIAMEFVEGVDVERIIDDHTPISLADRLGIAIDVLLGLSYAHKRGVVHRDIKPANIRLGEDGRAKIMDFGVAHLESAKMTATGTMMGTPNYMAPEQVTGEKIGPATDIFSLGAVLYELLTHRKAFAGESLHNVLFKVVSEDPPALSLVVDLPQSPELQRIVRRALAKDPADRYQSAQEMANELTNVRARLKGTSQTGSLSLSATITAETRRRHEANNPRSAPWHRSGGAVVVASLIGAAAIFGSTRLWISSRRAQSVGSDSARSTVLSAPTPPVVAADRDAAKRRSATPLPPATPAITADSDRTRAAAAISDRELAVTRVVQRSARDARARAVAAGATSAQLAGGNAALRRSERLLAAGRYAEAVSAMNEAIESWSIAATVAAGRQSQNVTSSSGAVPNVRPQPESDTVRRLTTPSVRPAPPVAPPAVAPSTLPPQPSATTSRAESDTATTTAAIAAVVTGYARAIEARDIAAIRALYPSITAEQQRGFERFFAAVKSLKASLAADKPEVNGATASARIAGIYEYADASGQAQRQPVAFQATFRRDGGSWLIASVR